MSKATQTRWLVGSVAALALFVTACGDDSTPASSEPPAPTQDIVEIAQDAGVFNTLLAAAQAAGLVEALQAPGPITVFAPTDDAFAALPDGTVESLLLPENLETLTSILTYHVVEGSVLAADAVAAGSAPTLNGQSVTITTSGDSVLINDSTVVQADILATNGVVHVIDAVLLPE